MMSMVMLRRMVVCVRGSIYDGDAGVDALLSSEVTFGAAVSWAVSVVGMDAGQ